MQIKRIYLTGFMTSGKSTIGPILANVLGWSFFDLDNVVEKTEGTTIVEIFKNNGHEYFRDLEEKCLKEISLEEDVIISLGGGTISNKNNILHMKRTGKLIYLKSSPEAIYRRIRKKPSRPLFRDLVLSNASDTEFLERINGLLDERSKFYEQSDYTFNTDKTPIGITVDTIAKKINTSLNEKNKNFNS